MESRIIATWVPPGLRRIVNRAIGAAIVYKGPYPSWADAARASSGYDHVDILARVIDATGRVLRGEAEYEQDGVPMHATPPAGHTLASLLMAAALEAGRLSVLDFGGGLGSRYLKWRRWLTPLAGMQWCVVEQSHFVDAGAQLFAGMPAMSFVRSIEQAKAHGPNVAIASGVLQYLPEPMSALDMLIEADPRLIIIDRTPFDDDNVARIMTQHVPRRLGAASYPLWLLSRAELHARLSERYLLLCEFPTSDAPLRSGRISGEYLGCTWLRRN